MGLLLLCAVLAAAGAPDFVSSGESNEKLHQINSRISRLKKRERYKRQKWGISGKLKKKKNRCLRCGASFLRFVMRASLALFRDRNQEGFFFF